MVKQSNVFAKCESRRLALLAELEKVVYEIAQAPSAVVEKHLIYTCHKVGLDPLNRLSSI
jgi:hypothetical protein